MKESHSEGVANHIDPESCGEPREGLAEALTGESTVSIYKNIYKNATDIPLLLFCTLKLSYGSLLNAYNKLAFLQHGLDTSQKNVVGKGIFTTRHRIGLRTASSQRSVQNDRGTTVAE